MERMLSAKKKEPIIFQHFYDTYNRELKGKSKVYTNQDIKQVPRILIPTPEVLAQNCSLEKLNVRNGLNAMEFKPGITEQNRVAHVEVLEDSDVNLNTYNELSKWKESLRSNPFGRSQVMYKMVPPPVFDDVNLHSSNSSDNGELLVVIRVYRPTRAIHMGQSLEKPVFAEEFHCLGSNYLAEFRDKISCICNGKKFFDISTYPDAEITKNETDSGYFYIQGTFYNDERSIENVDYSKTVINWAKTARGLSRIEFKTANMVNTRFLDLTAGLGFPQLYLHHGNCEHLFVFSQLEYIPPNATAQYPPRDQFPYLCTYNIYKNYVCHMCGARRYNFIVEQSKRQLYDPTYLCNECFYSFHYVDGKKIGQFKAYRILDSIEDKATFEKEDVENLSENDLHLHFEIEIDDINIKDECET